MAPGAPSVTREKAAAQEMRDIPTNESPAHDAPKTSCFARYPSLQIDKDHPEVEYIISQVFEARNMRTPRASKQNFVSFCILSSIFQVFEAINRVIWYLYVARLRRPYNYQAISVRPALDIVFVEFTDRVVCGGVCVSTTAELNHARLKRFRHALATWYNDN